MTLSSCLPAKGSALAYVLSVEPSSTKSISKFGKSTLINDCKVSTIQCSSLCAGTNIDTFGVSIFKLSLKVSILEVSRKAKNIISQYLANVSRVKIKKNTGKTSLNWEVMPSTRLR